EGYRGEPRLKPPFPAVKGLYGKPTVVNNVETVCNLPHIVLNGADWFKAIGTPTGAGTRLWCMSAHVNRPGIYEMENGTPIRELRQVHPLPGGHLLDGEPLRPVRRRRRETWRYRSAARHRLQHRWPLLLPAW